MATPCPRSFRWLGSLASLVLAACSSTARLPLTSPVQPVATAAGQPASASSYACRYSAPNGSRGHFYQEDGPLELPADLERIPEPIPRAEPLHRWANNPYTVLGQSFTPQKTVGVLHERGIGSWYGRKFHGQKTSSGERYDMFSMTAAHPTLPIPSYARVTHVKNGRSVVVRINDRGPFLKGRVIDLSFLAACRLGYAQQGSAELEVVSLVPGAAPLIPAPPAPVAPVPASVRVAAIPAVSNDQGIFLQLGAFSSRANAENFHARLSRELGDAQQAQLAIHEADRLFRVRLGPFVDRAAAQAAAEALTGHRPVLVHR